MAYALLWYGSMCGRAFHRILWLALAAASGWVSAAAQATTFVEPTEADLASQSIAIVDGVVLNSYSAADPSNAGVNTYIVIEPQKVLWGDLSDGVIILRERGGSVAGFEEHIFGSPRYSVGEEVIVFLSRDADGTLHTTQMALGKFSVVRNASGAITVRRNFEEGVAVLNQKGGWATDWSAQPLDLDSLVAEIRAATAGRIPQPVVVEQSIPAEMDPDRLFEYQLPFTYLSPTNPARWFEPDKAQPISYLIDATGDAKLGPIASRAAVDSALAAWTNVSSSNINLVDGGLLSPAVRYAGCTGVTRVVFNDPFNEIADPTSCSGILAIGGYCSSSETTVVGGTTFRRIVIAKVTFNNGFSACSGWTFCNLAEVATHELGHTIGFGSSADTTATMHATAHFDGRCAGLRSDDTAAVRAVYPEGAGTPPAPTPTATPSQTPTPPATAAASLTPTPDLPQTPTTSRHVRGRIHYYASAIPVSGAIVALTGTNSATTQTDETGTYAFMALDAGRSTVEAHKSGDFGSALSAIDAAHVLQAAVGLRSLNDAQRCACDASGNGQISAIDATLILQKVVGLRADLPAATLCSSDWLFLPEPSVMPNQTLIPPQLSGDACQNGAIAFDLLDDAADNQDFGVALIGDCNLSWAGSGDVAALQAGRGADHVVSLGTRRINGRRLSFALNVSGDGEFHAFEARLQYNPEHLTFLGLRDVAATLATTRVVPSGRLHIAMANAAGMRSGTALVLEFKRRSRRFSTPQLLSAVVDTEHARGPLVRVERHP